MAELGGLALSRGAEHVPYLLLDTGGARVGNASLSLGERVSRSGALTSRSVTGEGSLPSPSTWQYPFYCFEHRWAIELDGNVHSQPSQIRNDAVGEDYLRTRLLRIPNGLELEDGEEFVSRVQEAMRGG